MAHYENVDVISLKRAINDCKNSINYKNEENILSNIQRNDIWVCEAKKNLYEALDFLVDQKLKKLKPVYSKFNQIAGYIKNYQKKQERVERLKNRLLNSWSSRESNQRASWRREINRLQREMRELKAKINGLKSDIYEELNTK